MVQDSASRKLDQYIVRFPDGMRDELKHAAARNNRSLNAEIVARLEDSFGRDSQGRITLSLPNALLTRMVEAWMNGPVAEGEMPSVDLAGGIERILLREFPPLSLDEFHRQWLRPIIDATDEQKDALAAKADRLLAAQWPDLQVHLLSVKGKRMPMIGERSTASKASK